jgi:hypothetical protein
VKVAEVPLIAVWDSKDAGLEQLVVVLVVSCTV